MSRQPPGGTSTFSFGNEESPFKKSPGSTPARSIPVDALLDGQLTEEQKNQIHALVDLTTDAEELVAKLSGMLIRKAPPASEALNGTHSGDVRGFQPPTEKVESALESLRDAMKRRGVDTLARLAKKFKIMDKDHNRKLCYDEMKQGFAESGCVISEADMHAIFRSLDTDCSGDISLDEFYVGIRGGMNERRTNLVMSAFAQLDVNGDGALTVTDLSGMYDCSRHPDVVSGIATEVDVLQNFLSGFDGTMSTPTKIITPEKFANYYAGVSASVDDDDYFELMIRNVWHLSGGEGAYENTTCRRLLVTHDDGSQTIEVIDEEVVAVSKEDLQEMKRRLIEQGVPVVKIALYTDQTSSDPPTTSSPRKFAKPAPTVDNDVIVASAYKQRMAASSVTF